MELKKTFVIISVSDRVDMLNNLVESIMRYDKFKDYDLCLMFQDYTGNRDEIKYKDKYATIVYADEPLGCHWARVELLQNIKYDIYVNLDDDVELGEYTNYDKAIEKALEPDTGFVLTNWARSDKAMEAKIPKIQDKFVKQVLIYQGGGMIYSDKIAELMRTLPKEKYRYDDLWSLTAYIEGYSNYRYLGSLTVHRILGQGGMKRFMRRAIRPLACWDYIDYRKIEGARMGEEYCIGVDSDLKPIVRELHKKNKK